MLHKTVRRVNFKSDSRCSSCWRVATALFPWHHAMSSWTGTYWGQAALLGFLLAQNVSHALLIQISRAVPIGTVCVWHGCLF